jgi:glycerol uptake facilitator-like aquaporin
MPNNITKLLAEFIGSMMLLTVVIGSGIMAERLSGGNDAIALLGNTFATVFGLYVLIEVFGPISGAHFNPAVSAIFALKKALKPGLFCGYVATQLLGAIAGACLAHAMFDITIWQVSSKVRTGQGQWLAEVVASAGLIFVILSAKADKAPLLVACYIGAAYWFTASTSFANPAAVLGRMLSNSFAGIAPASALPFVASQCLGALLGLWLYRRLSKTTSESVSNHI